LLDHNFWNRKADQRLKRLKC